MFRRSRRVVPPPSSSEEPMQVPGQPPEFRPQLWEHANSISPPTPRPRLAARVHALPGHFRRLLMGLQIIFSCGLTRSNSTPVDSGPADIGRGAPKSASRKASSTPSNVRSGASSHASSCSMYTAPSAASWSNSSSSVYTARGKESSSGRHSTTPPPCGSSPSRSSPIPMALENLSFHRILGKGTFGTVSLASHPARDDLPLAVKVAAMKNTTFQKACTERHALMTTNTSPFFSHLYATLQTSRHFCFVMEYAGGGDLKQFIHARSPMDAATVRFISAEILCGLRFMHHKGVVHRDLKPANILLDSGGHVKISDFGLALINMSKWKTSQHYAGTPHFCAPEIFQHRPYNWLADYFSFGIIVCMMALATYPFNCNQALEHLRRSICQDKPRLPRKTDRVVRDFILGLLAKEPITRSTAVTKLPNHPFFSGIDWEEIFSGNACPPYTMGMGPPDLSITRASPIDSDPPSLVPQFNYVCHRWRDMVAKRHAATGGIKSLPPPVA